jgi:hypothetical protein
VGVVSAVLCFPRPAGALSISAPPGPVSIGTVNTTDGGTVISAQLGNVSASDNGVIILLGSFDATVSISATSFFTGSGSSYETIPRANVKYWSGNASSHSGSCTAGQSTSAQAVDLTTSRPAYSCGGLLTVSATWNPTIVITLPTTLIAGTYTATITHSAA